MFLIPFLLVFTISAYADNNIENQSWKKVVESKTVNIENLIGDIRIRFGGYDSEVEGLVVIQRNEKAGQLQVKEFEKDGVYYIKVIRFNKQLNKEIELNQKDSARADLTLFIAENKEVFATTDNGFLEAKGLKSKLTLKSNFGNIKLSKNKQAVNVYSNHGKIDASLIQNKTNDTQEFVTLTGDINLWIGEKDNYDINLETSSDITSNFSTHIENFSNQEPNKKGSIKTNGGGQIINLKSKRGNVAVRTYPQFDNK